jgi:hypothetical protein
MTSFNLTDLYNNLKRESDERDQNTKTKSPYKTVFVKPNGSAKINIRLLPNPASGGVSFTYKVHKMNDGKTLLCGKNNRNNPEARCELCDALVARKNVTGQDQKEYATSRTILFAQYVSSIGYDFSEKYPAPKEGEIIILMGPASLHQQIANVLITNGQESLSKILTDYDGGIINIGRDQQGRNVIANSIYATFKSAPSQADYEQLIRSLPTLESIALNGGMTESDFVKLHEAATAVLRTIQTQSVAQTTAQPSVDAIVQQQTNFGYAQPSPVQQPAQQAFTPQQIYDAQYNVQKQVPNVGEQVLPSQPSTGQVQPSYATGNTQQPVQPQVIHQVVQPVASQPAVNVADVENDALRKLLLDVNIDSDDLPF